MFFYLDYLYFCSIFFPFPLYKFCSKAPFSFMPKTCTYTQTTVLHPPIVLWQEERRGLECLSRTTFRQNECKYITRRCYGAWQGAKETTGPTTDDDNTDPLSCLPSRSVFTVWCWFGTKPSGRCTVWITKGTFSSMLPSPSCLAINLRFIEKGRFNDAKHCSHPSHRILKNTQL